MLETPVEFRNQAGELLKGTLYEACERSEKAVIFCHGFAGKSNTPNKVPWARALAKAGYLVLTFDFSGHGASEGNLGETTYTKQVGELDGAIEFLKKRGIRKIGVLGHSTGAVIAMIAAEKRKDVNAVACLSAFLNPLHCPPNPYTHKQLVNWEKEGEIDYVEGNEVVKINYAFRKDQITYNLKEIVKSIKQPVIFINSKRDQYIDYHEAAEMFSLASDPKEILLIEGADHGFTEHFIEVNWAITNFFDKYVQ